jgi:protoporphyrinogen oxidase
MAEYDFAVLGAGPSGLTTAYCLGKTGARTAVLEHAPHCGGLMRGVSRGDFTFDLGRKELYSRFPEVHALWTELLGEDYREYPHRVGVLYDGSILEKEWSYKGRFRGMSAAQVARLSGSYLLSQIKPGERVARSVEDFFLLRYGRAYYDYFVCGFNLKFEGRPPAGMPNLEGEQSVPRFGFLRPRSKGEESKADPLFSGQDTWRHPARGTQQIVDRLEEESRARGVEFLLDTEVLAIELDGEGAHRIRFRRGGEEAEIAARYVVSSVPIPFLMSLLQPRVPEELREPPAEEVLFKKSTSLVYLLADGEPRFPHNWLEVTDLKFKMGRVVNYATWNGVMIPKGKMGLCIEYFSVDGDPLMELDKESLYELAVHEAATNGLIERSRIYDHLVIKLPKTNASTVIHDRKQAWLRDAAAYVAALPRFFETSRPGMDRATLAGIEAAEACVSGNAMQRRSLAASSAEL